MCPTWVVLNQELSATNPCPSKSDKPDATNWDHVLSATRSCHDQQQSPHAVGRNHSDNDVKHIKS